MANVELTDDPNVLIYGPDYHRARDHRSFKARSVALAEGYRQMTKLLGMGQLTLIGTGCSGNAVVGALSIYTGAPFALVRRKRGESPHDPYGMITGSVTQNGYIFVDDLICSGSTLEHVLVAMTRDTHTSLRGILTYSQVPSEKNAWLGSSFAEDTREVPYYPSGSDAPHMQTFRLVNSAQERKLNDLETIKNLKARRDCLEQGEREYLQSLEAKYAPVAAVGRPIDAASRVTVMAGDWIQGGMVDCVPPASQEKTKTPRNPFTTKFPFLATKRRGPAKITINAR